jgi:hypothetical protein
MNGSVRCKFEVNTYLNVDQYIVEGNRLSVSAASLIFSLTYLPPDLLPSLSPLFVLG